MKTTKRIFSFILALVMLLSTAAVAAFAEQSKNYLVLGDSIGFGSGIKNPREACFGKIVADSNGYNYKNDADPGQTSKRLLQKISEPGVKADIEEADIISISIGGNNFLLDNIPKLVLEVSLFKRYDTVNKILDNFKADFRVIIKTIKSYNPDVLIVVQTLYNPMPGALHDVFGGVIEKLNDVYKTCLDDMPGAYIIADVAAAFPADPELVAFDFIHPSAKGNKVIAQVILDTLRENGRPSADVIVLNAEGEDTGTKVIRAFFISGCKFLNMLHKVK